MAYICNTSLISDALTKIMSHAGFCKEFVRLMIQSFIELWRLLCVKFPFHKVVYRPPQLSNLHGVYEDVVNKFIALSPLHSLRTCNDSANGYLCLRIDWNRGKHVYSLPAIPNLILSLVLGNWKVTFSQTMILVLTSLKVNRLNVDIRMQSLLYQHPANGQFGALIVMVFMFWRIVILFLPFHLMISIILFVLNVFVLVVCVMVIQIAIVNVEWGVKIWPTAPYVFFMTTTDNNVTTFLKSLL